MLLHEIDELVELDHPGIILIDFAHDLFYSVVGVFEAEGAHEIGELGLVDVLWGNGKGTLEWLVSKI